LQETDKSNNTEYIERENQVIELSKQNKSTRYIAEALKMSLRDIGLIRKKYGINPGIVMTTFDQKFYPLLMWIAAIARPSHAEVLPLSEYPCE
jgi:hypothetical protein